MINSFLIHSFQFLGFYHEHTRPDRAQYITIDWDEIERVEREDFLFGRFRKKKQYEPCYNCRTFGAYDYNSIMHYPVYLGTKNRTIIKVQNGSCDDSTCNIGQRKELSELDVVDIQRLYKCGKYLHS